MPKHFFLYLFLKLLLNNTIALGEFVFVAGAGTDVMHEMRRGEKVGIVGKSGQGKSTFVKLLLRLQDIESGEIRIGEHQIRDIKINSLWQNIAYIPQEICKHSMSCCGALSP